MNHSGIVLASIYPVLRLLKGQGLAHRTRNRWFPGAQDPGYTNVLDIGKI